MPAGAGPLPDHLSIQESLLIVDQQLAVINLAEAEFREVRESVNSVIEKCIDQLADLGMMVYRCEDERAEALRLRQRLMLKLLTDGEAQL